MMLHNHILKSSEKLKKRNVLKIYAKLLVPLTLQISPQFDIVLLLKKVKIFDLKTKQNKTKKKK